jgi:hypothetical protein
MTPPAVPDRGPLAHTLARLDAADEYCRFVDGEPGGGGWHRLDEVLADVRLLDDWYQTIVDGAASGKRDVAGSYFAGWLSGVIVDSAAIALVAEQRSWPLRASNLAVHRHDEGWFDGIAVLAPDVRMLSSDPDAHHPHAVSFGRVDQLRSVLIDETVELAGRLFSEIRARAPYGVRGMWGALADGLAATLVHAADDADDDIDAAWKAATALLDALDARVGVPFNRPRLDRAEWSGGCSSFTVKGTCCLYYKTVDGASGPSNDDYCTTCPLRDERWRRERHIAWLEEHRRQPT